MADMLIAIISTLISSIALAGIALSLLLQARQLRASRIQAARAAQVDLMNFAIDNPTLVNDLEGVEDVEGFVKNVVRNWYFSYLSMSYDNKTITRSSLCRIAQTVFATEAARTWWAEAGYSFDEVATSRREKEFSTIIGDEFQRVKRTFDPVETADMPQRSGLGWPEQTPRL
jgi:hypothetical protein